MPKFVPDESRPVQHGSVEPARIFEPAGIFVPGEPEPYDHPAFRDFARAVDLDRLIRDALIDCSAKAAHGFYVNATEAFDFATALVGLVQHRAAAEHDEGGQ